MQLFIETFARHVAKELALFKRAVSGLFANCHVKERNRFVASNDGRGANED